MTQETKENIVKDYLEKLQIDQQPALVYEHYDTAHPHFHVVMNNVNSKGERINFYQKVKQYSEQARKQIEQDYDLIKAEGRSLEKDPDFDIPKGKVSYGERATKATLNKVISYVRDRESYTSISEFKKALNKYGVTLDQGAKGSPQRKNGGLVYGFADENGKQVGRGIKASRFYKKPTLKNLMKEINKNKALKKKHFKEVAKAVNSTYYANYSLNKNDFKNQLSKKGINLSYQTDNTGNIKSIEYTHKQSGAKYTDQDFKLNSQKLYQKLGGHTISYKEVKALNKSIARYYRSLQRKNNIPFESAFHNYLDKEKFLESYAQKNPDTDRRAIGKIGQNFLNYKEKQQPKLKAKDNKKFSGYARPIIDYVRNNKNLQLQEKVDFLSKMGIGIKQTDDAIYYVSSEHRSIGIETKEYVAQHLKTPFKPFKAKKLKQFKSEQKQFFSSLAKLKSKNFDSFKGNKLYNYYNPQIQKYINPKDRKLVERRINRRTAKQRITEPIKNIKDVEKLMDLGLIIRPIKQDHKYEKRRYIAHHFQGKPSNSIILDKDINQQLSDINYDSKAYNSLIHQRLNNGRISHKYNLMVMLNEMKTDKQYNRFEKIHSYMAKVMPKQATNVKYKIAHSYNSGKSLSEKDYNEIVDYAQKQINAYRPENTPKKVMQRFKEKAKTRDDSGGNSLGPDRNKESEQDRIERKRRKEFDRELDQGRDDDFDMDL